LPKADSTVAVLASDDVSWHRITLPRAPSARLRAALAGVLEDMLLDDAEAAHFALPAKAAAGSLTWVAVMHRAWLAAVLTELESAGLAVDRLAPALWPGDVARGRFCIEPGGSTDAPLRLELADADGVRTVRLQGTLPRQLLPSGAAVRFSAQAAAAAAAERWLGAAVAVRSDAEQLLDSARGPWNLRQFDLLAKARGVKLLRAATRRFASTDWRLVRWGLVTLAALQLVGLNAWAWQQSQTLADRRQAMVDLLKSSFPQVRAVLDAPLQMQREIELLRAAAGRPGDNDLEALLAAAATAWPEGVPPAQTLRFEAGRLTLTAPGLGQEQVAPMRERLRATGLDAEWAEGRVSIFRAATRKSA
jgi:general secretion pathway protein L